MRKCKCGAIIEKGDTQCVVCGTVFKGNGSTPGKPHKDGPMKVAINKAWKNFWSNSESVLVVFCIGVVFVIVVAMSILDYYDKVT